MERQIINLGSAASNGTGTKARSAGKIINENFEEVYSAIEVLTRIDRIEEPKGFSELVDQNITIYADWRWFINSESYTNLEDFEITDIPYSAAGMVRYVFIVPNEVNGFSVISGDEFIENPQTPVLPNNGIYVTFFTVSDTDFGNPSPIISDISLQKAIDGGDTARVSNEDFTEQTDVIIKSNDLSFQQRNNDYDSDSRIGINHGKAYMQQANVASEEYTVVDFEKPIANTGIRFPAKSVAQIYTVAMVEDLENAIENVNNNIETSNSDTLESAQTYASNLITQLINGAPADSNTLKELSDKIIAIQSIIGGTAPDGDSVVNTVTELLAIFSTYPEGVNLVTALAGKVNATDVYNALDCIVAGKVLDARQGKVLFDTLTTLTTVVNNKVDEVTGKSLLADIEISKLAILDATTDLNKPVSTATSAAIQAQIVNSTIVNGVTTSSSVPATGNIHALGIGPGTYPNWGGMVIPANNTGTLQRVGGVYSVSLTPVVLTTFVQKNELTGVLNIEQAPYATINGFIGNDGQIASSSASWKYSGFLKCSQNDVFDINAFGHPAVNSISFYDSNLTFISGRSVVSGDYLVASVTAPVNTTFFRISYASAVQTSFISSFIYHYNTVSEINKTQESVKAQNGTILKRNLKLNLLQNRIALQYFDYLQGGYPKASNLANAQLPIFFQKQNGTIIADADFFYKNNVTYRNFAAGTNESSGFIFDVGYTELLGVNYFEFKIKFPTSTNKDVTAFSVMNGSGGRKTYFYNGKAYANQQSNTDITNIQIVYETQIGVNTMQTWRFIHTYNSSLTSSGVLNIGHYSEGGIPTDCWFGDFICSREPIENNVVYVDKPTMNNSQYIGKNIMIFGDSNLRVSIGSTMIQELGCNVFINADGGRAMRFRDVGAVSADLNWLYHWNRRLYVKSLKDIGVDIDSFVFFTSYNDTSGGGEITYSKIADVENNYPVIGDSSGVITSKLALFNALTDAQKALKFDYQQTFCAYLKQLINLYPLASIYLNEVLYSPAGSPQATYTEDTTVQRNNDKSIRDSLNSQINTVSDWFGIPVLRTGKNARYYYGNMTQYTSDTIHFDFRIGKRIGFYVSKKLLESL